MPQVRSQEPDDSFDGLRLHVSAWKALDSAHITSLEQLKTLALQLDQIPSIDPQTARIIEDRLAVRRTVQVRLIFPKRPHRK